MKARDDLLTGREHEALFRKLRDPASGSRGSRVNPRPRGLQHECRKLAARASPQAMHKLIALMDDEDER